MTNPNRDKLPPDLSRLRQLLVKYFSLEEIRTLCLDLGVRYDDLGGEGISAKVRELLLQLDRTKRIEALVQRVEILRPKVDWRGGPLPEAVCPYKGLHAFREADKDNFFGRDMFTKKLKKAVDERSLVAVVGPSGSGKSSVVYAGLLPKLPAESWRVVSFRPGNDPFLALAKALVPLLDPSAPKMAIPRIARRKLKPELGGENKAERIPLSDYLQQIQEEYPDAKLLLIIDQFEELYTQVDQEVRRDFLDVLLAVGFGAPALESPAHSFATLLLTMRADFMGQALAYPPMVDALQGNDVKIGLMSRDELALAIEQPALNQGVRFADGLVTRILEDVGDHAGNLPLLEFALTLLWERQTGRQMTHAAYEAIGGVSGALAQHANETLAKLTQNGKDKEAEQAIQRVMVQLVQPGAGAEDTRRVARRADLGDAGWTLAQRLAAEDARLLVTGRGNDDPESDNNAGESDNEDPETDNEDPEITETVEVIHEALIQNWGQLQAWMDQDREFRMWQERLRSDLALWQKNEKQKGYLLQGAPLTVAADWLGKRRDDLSSLEIEYIEASLRKRKGDNLRRIGTAILVAVLLIGASIIVAVIQSQAATDIGIEATKGAIAEENAEAAATTSAAVAATSDHNERLARESEEDAQEARATAEANERLANARWLVGQGQAIYEEDPLLGLALVLEGLVLIESDTQGEGPVINDDEETNQNNMLADSRERVFQWGRQALLGDNVEEFYADRDNLVIDHRDKANEWWKISTNGVAILALPEGDILDVAFSADGRFIAIVNEDEAGISYTQVHDLHIEQRLNFVSDGPVRSIAFSANSRFMVVSYEDEVGISYYSEVYDLQTKQRPDFVADGPILMVDFFADGRFMVVGYQDGFADFYSEVYDLQTEQRLEFVADGPIGDVNFSADGQFIVVDYLDEYSEVYDLRTEQQPDFFADDLVQTVDISPDGHFMVVGYQDKEGNNSYREVYDLQTEQRLDFIADGPIRDVTFSADNRFMVVSFENEANHNPYSEIYDLQTEQQPDFVADDVILGVEFYADGRFMGVLHLGESNALYLEVYDLKTEQRLDFLDEGPVLGINISSDGHLMVVHHHNTVDYYSEVYDLQTEQHPRFIADGPIQYATFAADDRFMVIDYLVGEDIVYDVLNEATVARGDALELQSLTEDTLFQISYGDGSNDLRYMSITNTVWLAPMGTNIAETVYISSTHQIAVSYLDGSAYLLNLAWLEAMNGQVATLPIGELVQLACDYPLRDGLPVGAEERLMEIIEEINAEPRACAAPEQSGFLLKST